MTTSTDHPLSRFCPLSLALRTVLVCAALFAGTGPACAQSTASQVGYFMLEFVAGTTVHHGLLTEQDNAAAMWVSYHAHGRSELVWMPLTWTNGPHGLVLAAGTPIDLHTGEKHRTYASDNLLVRTYPDGTTRVWNVDSRNNRSEVILTKIPSAQEFHHLLDEFYANAAIPRSSPRDGEPPTRRAPPRDAVPAAF